MNLSTLNIGHGNEFTQLEDLRDELNAFHDETLALIEEQSRPVKFSYGKNQDTPYVNMSTEVELINPSEWIDGYVDTY